MQDFLKKYSTVPNEFIDDFFNIAKEDYIDDDLIIDFDVVVKWLGVEKRNLKRLLIKKFSENKDYKIFVRNLPHERGAAQIEDIVITPDCFKELCMFSHTTKAEKVRFYYLTIEKLIRKYHWYIQEKLLEKIKMLEQNQKPKVNVQGGVIYFFKALNQLTLDEFTYELYKIGKTTNEKNRFITYNSGNADDIEPLFVLEVSDIDKVEQCIKNLIKNYQYRKYKEIYKIDVDTLKEAFASCDELIVSFKNYTNKNNSKSVDKNNSKSIDKNFRDVKSDNEIFLVFGKGIMDKPTK